MESIDESKETPSKEEKKKYLPLTWKGLDISAAQDAILGKDKIDGHINLNQQKAVHRSVLFLSCLVICGLLYLLFFTFVIHALWSKEFFLILIMHKHIGAFILALLIVPSALLWGMLRAAYMSDRTQTEPDSLVKAATSLHPFGDG